MNTIRIAAKAVIVEDNKLLLSKFKDSSGIYYRLPGGGQNHNELLSETVCRECLEEIGTDVTPIDLIHTFEYIRDRHDHSFLPEGFHQVDVVFHCKRLSDIMHHEPTELDESQIGVEWVDLSTIMDVTIYPLAYRDIVRNFAKGLATESYLGHLI